MLWPCRTTITQNTVTAVSLVYLSRLLEFAVLPIRVKIDSASPAPLNAGEKSHLGVKAIPILTLFPAFLWAQTSVVLSHKAPAESELTANADSTFWGSIQGISMDADYFGKSIANHRTEVRSRWTPSHLYLLYICNYEELNLKPNPSTAAETPQLWNWDVVEAFLGPDLANIQRYFEFEVSPQGEWIDLEIDRTGERRGGGAAWNSGMQAKARIDAARKVWYGEMKIPFDAMIGGPAISGRKFRAGFFRIAGRDPDKKKISWQATGRTTFHVPEKFSTLILVD